MKVRSLPLAALGTVSTNTAKIDSAFVEEGIDDSSPLLRC